MKDIAGVFWFCAEGHTEGGCGGLWGVGGKGSSVRGRVWRTVGSGWKRVISQRAGVADCGEWVEKGRQSEGRVCVWVCVQGLRGSKASHFRI